MNRGFGRADVILAKTLAEHGAYPLTALSQDDWAFLARDLALMATMWGLVIAIPMTLLGGYMMVRIGRLTDQVKEDISQFLRDYESSVASAKS